MTPDLANQFVEQFKELVEEFRSLRDTSEHKTFTGANKTDLQMHISRGRAAVHRIAPGTTHVTDTESLFGPAHAKAYVATILMGIL